MSSATNAYERYQAVRIFGSLDGLRCISIALVLWHHSPIAERMVDPVVLLTRGFVGVNFFFVLSGFLITTLLLREETRNGSFSIKGFYWRRFLRIAPVYFLLVTLLGLYWVWIKGLSEMAALLPFYYLFLANFLTTDIPLLAPTWSLSVEEQYYLIWPAMLLLLPSLGRVRMGVLLGLIAFCVIAAMGGFAVLNLQPVETENALWVPPFSSYSAILLGALAAVILNTPKGYAVLHQMFSFTGAPLVAFAALIIALSVLPPQLAGGSYFIMHILMTLCLITIVIREDHVLARVLSFRPVARIGEISYGIYLYHLIGLHVAWEIMTRFQPPEAVNLWAVMGLFLVLSYIISEISFRTYEAYFLSFKRSKTHK